MKKLFIIILTIVKIFLQVTCNKVSVCECQNALGYYAYDTCQACPKECQRVICSKHRYVKAGAHNILQVPVLQCQTQKGGFKNNWYTMNPTTVCEKPKIFFGCFIDLINPTDMKPRLINTTCRTSYIHRTECSEFYKEISCKPTIQITETYGIKNSFNIYKPVTFDHFDLIGIRTDFWDKRVDDEYEGFEILDKIKEERDLIDLDFIKKLAIHAFHTKTPEIPSTLEDFQFFINEQENIYVEFGYDTTLKSIIVSFRGTHFLDQEGSLDFNNIINDIKVVQKPTDDICGGCKIHTGFISSFVIIKENVRKTIYKLKEKYTGGLYFTGHSYGGALATLAAASFMKIPEFSSCLVTFGAPRVGNQEFAAYINSNIYGKNFRVTYKDDPVVKVPSNTTYLHSSTEIHFTNYNTYSNMEKEQDLTGNDYEILKIGDHSDYRLIYSTPKIFLFIE